jgi:hypothetical protein
MAWLSTGITLPSYGNEIQNLEIIHLCEIGSLSESEIERQYGLTSLALFMIMKNKAIIWYILNTYKLTLFLSSGVCW